MRYIVTGVCGRYFSLLEIGLVIVFDDADDNANDADDAGNDDALDRGVDDGTGAGEFCTKQFVLVVRSCRILCLCFVTLMEPSLFTPFF